MSMSMMRDETAGGDTGKDDALWAERFWCKHYAPGVPETIDDELAKWPSLARLFEADAQRFADRVGFVAIGTEITYGRMLSEARAFASWLVQNGLRPGERVALMMPNCLQYPAALFGTLFAGGVVVNVNPLYTPHELQHQLRDSGAVVVVVMEMFAATLEKALPGTDVRLSVTTAMGDMLGGLKGFAITAAIRHVKRLVPRYDLGAGRRRWKNVMRQGRKLPFRMVERQPEDLAFLQYTGGTTGAAKGAMLSNRNVVANVLQGRAWGLGRMEAADGISNVTMLPLYHIFSLTANLLMFTGVGGRNILIANPRDTDMVVRILRKENFSCFAGVNTLFSSLMNNEEFCKRNFSKLQMTISGGMAAQTEVAQRWQKITGAPFIEGYGMTETSPVVSVGYIDYDHPEKMGFTGKVGFPVPSTEVRMRRPDGSWCGIGEAGELCVRGPQVMQGYWNRPDETAKVMIGDGWLATGDIGVMDENGEIKLVDRIKDMVLVSGFNVYPSEVEDVIASHPAVREVAVIGVPDDHGAEMVKAIVVLRDGAVATQAEIIRHCRGQLTGYKIPRAVAFRTEPLPKTPVGKVLKRELRGS
ncbi:AMP-binding protein [Acetobacteraceae bacterium KSS8]|uniref:Long-chain-fatty-acid--CoA ligase n=1 Tax=Endosaccharibacter trunci TaxID=2812733 RepID=A0ABT1W959_9PROT|nr:AMP-binding protein [Acetobacteraceae bacterium KSS8]